MNLQEAYNILNFWINKAIGSYLTPDELDDVTDRGSLAAYKDLQPKAATSQQIRDALLPFREPWDFIPSNTISGYLPVPSNLNYLNLINVRTSFAISGRTIYWDVPFPNDDELTSRLNSLIEPVTGTNPVGEQIAPGLFKLYPLQGYTGTVTFYRRPVKPHFAYTTISGRVIVYDAANSVQLEWPENWQDYVLIKALSSIGVNLSDQEISQFAEVKSNNNWLGANTQ